jgi:hypothetical protein
MQQFQQEVDRHDDAGHGKQRVKGPDCELPNDDQDGLEVLDHSLPSASGLSGASGFDSTSKPPKS